MAHLRAGRAIPASADPGRRKSGAARRAAAEHRREYADTARASRHRQRVSALDIPPRWSAAGAPAQSGALATLSARYRAAARGDWPADLLPRWSRRSMPCSARVDRRSGSSVSSPTTPRDQLRTPPPRCASRSRRWRSPSDSTERMAWSAASLAAVDRASLLVGQMLALARLDAGGNAAGSAGYGRDPERVHRRSGGRRRQCRYRDRRL